MPNFSKWYMQFIYSRISSVTAKFPLNIKNIASESNSVNGCQNECISTHGNERQHTVHRWQNYDLIIFLVYQNSTHPE